MNAKRKTALQPGITNAHQPHSLHIDKEFRKVEREPLITQ